MCVSMVLASARICIGYVRISKKAENYLLDCNQNGYYYALFITQCMFVFKIFLYNL